MYTYADININTLSDYISMDKINKMSVEEMERMICFGKNLLESITKQNKNIEQLEFHFNVVKEMIDTFGSVKKFDTMESLFNTFYFSINGIINTQRFILFLSKNDNFKVHKYSHKNMTFDLSKNISKIKVIINKLVTDDKHRRVYYQPDLIDEYNVFMLLEHSGTIYGFALLECMSNENMLYASVFVDIFTTAMVNLDNKINLIQAQDDACRDSMTKFYHQTYFKDNILKNMFEKPHKRKNEVVSLCMLDLDHFKKVNDTYGHPCGDYVILKFADILKHSTRKKDILVRYGGEEFIVVLPNTDLAGALKLCKQIQKKMRETIMDFETMIEPNDNDPTFSLIKTNTPLLEKQIERNNVSTLDELLKLKKIKIRFRFQKTSSMGIVEYKNNNFASPDELLSNLDKKLYNSKINGRDKITF